MSLSDVERRAGLSRPLPAGETVLWQATPAARAMIRSMFHLRGVAIYAAVAAVAVVVLAQMRGLPLGQAIASATLLVPVLLVALALFTTIGRMTARATTYTLTNRRLIFHIGVAYEMTVSIPLSAVTGAALRRRKDGSGDIALTVRDTGGIGFIALWPHVRTLNLGRPRPMLRALDDVEAVADLIGDALTRFNTARRAPVVPIRPSPATAAEAVAA